MQNSDDHLFTSMDASMDIASSPPPQSSDDVLFCGREADELAKCMIKEKTRQVRILKAIAGIWHGSEIYPRLKNCVGYIKVANPIPKHLFSEIYGKYSNGQHVKRGIYRAHLTDAQIVYKTIPIEIKHTKTVHFIFEILKRLTGEPIIATRDLTPTELKMLDSRVRWRKLKTKDIQVSKGANSRHFLRLLDRIFCYYKQRSNADDLTDLNATDVAESKRSCPIQLEAMFRDLDLQMSLSADTQIDDGDCDDEEKPKEKKKRRASAVNDQPTAGDGFALLLHVTIILVNPSDGRKTPKDIISEGVKVCDYINAHNKWGVMSIGTTLHCINVVADFRIPREIDIDQFQANLTANVIRANDITRAGSGGMVINLTKDMIKYPSLRIKIINMYGTPKYNVTLQIYTSGFVSITGPKTYNHLFACYPGIMLLMYSAISNQEVFLLHLERSEIDAEKHRQMCIAYEKRDKTAKLDEEYHKEKIYNNPQNHTGTTKKKRGKLSDAKKKPAVRKSDFARQKEKYIARYNSKYTTDFRQLQTSKDSSTTEWVSNVMSVFNYHSFGKKEDFAEWLHFVTC